MPGSSNDHLRAHVGAPAADGRREVLGGVPQHQHREEPPRPLTSEAHREFTGRRPRPTGSSPDLRPRPTGSLPDDDDDYDYSKLEMDVDSDSDGNDAGMGFLGSIVPDKDDNVSNMLLAQLGSTPGAAGTAGAAGAAGAATKRATPSRSLAPRQATPSTFHCEIASFIADQAFNSMGKSHAMDKRQAVRRIVS